MTRYLLILALLICLLPVRARSDCFSGDVAYVTGDMNIRKSSTKNSQVTEFAKNGDLLNVLSTKQGAKYCWIEIDNGWMAITKHVEEIPQSVLDYFEGKYDEAHLYAKQSIEENREPSYIDDSANDNPVSAEIEPILLLIAFCSIAFLIAIALLIKLKRYSRKFSITDVC